MTSRAKPSDSVRVSHSANVACSLTFRTMSLKTEEGRKKKIRAFLEMLERGETIYPNGKGKPRPAPASRKR